MTNDLFINLVIDGSATSLPLKTFITRKLMRAVEEPLAALHAVTLNKALQEAVLNDLTVLKMMTASGDYASEWVDKQKEYLTSIYPSIDELQMKAEIGKRFVAALSEEHPLVYKAMLFPTAEISVADDNAISAAIELLKVVIDTTALTEEQRTKFFTDDFWSEQNLSEVIDVVDKFRGLLQRGK